MPFATANEIMGFSYTVPFLLTLISWSDECMMKESFKRLEETRMTIPVWLELPCYTNMIHECVAACYKEKICFSVTQSLDGTKCLLYDQDTADDDITEKSDDLSLWTGAVLCHIVILQSYRFCFLSS